MLFVQGGVPQRDVRRLLGVLQAVRGGVGAVRWVGLVGVGVRVRELPQNSAHDHLVWLGVEVDGAGGWRL